MWKTTKHQFILFLFVVAAFILTQCGDKKPTKPPPPPAPNIQGVWQDTASGISISFGDSVWQYGLNAGTFDPELSEGTLTILGYPFANYQYEENILHLTIIEKDSTYTLVKTSTEPIITIQVRPGDSTLLGGSITKRGNYIAFASNRDGDEKGDLYIYTVDFNAYLDTLFYYDTAITQRDSLVIEITITPPPDTLSLADTAIDTTVLVLFDTSLVEKFVQPIRALTKRSGLDAMPAWSPDGSKLAFVSDTGGYQAVWIYFLDIFGNPAATSESLPQNPIQLTDPGSEKGDGSPSWSPDGKFITFERRDGIENVRDVFITPSDNYGETEPVTNFTKAPGNDCFNPIWSVQESLNIILFEQKESGQSQDWDIFLALGFRHRGLYQIIPEVYQPQPERPSHLVP